MKPKYVLLVVLILGLCNFFLFLQSLHLKSDLETALDQIRRQTGLAEGEVLTGFAGLGLNGDSVSIEYGDGFDRRLLIYFSPSCPWCARQLPFWRELESKCGGCSLLGVVNREEDPVQVRDYLSEHDLGELPVVFVDASVRQQYRFSATPTSLAVSGDGVVEHFWRGLWTADLVREEIEPYFDLELTSRMN